MSYDAWESSQGEAFTQVAVFCRHLLRDATTFTDNTQPPAAEVEIYLSNNYAKMAGIMARFGLSAAQTDATVIRILQSYQVACTVVDVEMSQPGAGVAKVPNQRFQSFLEQCGGFEKMLMAGNMQALTVVEIATGASTRGPEWTGALVSEKTLLVNNTNLVQPDITREMMKNPLVSSVDGD